MTRVLVVEDEQAGVMAEELRGRPLEVTTLSSTDAALARVTMVTSTSSSPI
jgi:CheY-like chemotaxis protein